MAVSRLSYRENLIEELQKELVNCEKSLRLAYDSDLLKEWKEITKKIEIQKSYLENELGCGE